MSGKAKSANQGQQRLPSIMTKQDVEGLSHLSDELKSFGVELLTKVPLNPVWAILGHDPEAQALMHLLNTGLVVLLHPDIQMAPGSPMNLMTIEVARRYGCEWQLSAMIEATNNTAKSWQPEDFEPFKLGALGMPESAHWTEEQRLSLEFTEACLENKMTDELWEQSLKTWGLERTVRYMMWVGYCNMWAILIESFRAPFTLGTFSQQPMPKEMVGLMKNLLEPVWEGMKQVIKDQPSLHGAV